MKNIIFISIILFFSIKILSQNTFELIISSNHEERLYDLIELSDGCFIISGKIDFGENSNGYIVKVNSEGKIIKEIIINIPNSNFVIQKITITNDNNFMLYGYAGSQSDGFNNIYIIRKYDLDFNLIFEKKYKTKLINSSIERIRIYNKDNSNIVLYGFVEVGNVFDLRYFFFEITANGDSIKLNQYSTESIYNVPYSLLEKKDKSGYYCYASKATGANTFASVILKLDTDFNIIGYNGLSQDVNLIHNNGELRWITDTSYIVCGTTYEINKNQDNDLGIAILDTTNHDVIAFNHSGKTDTIELYGIYKCMEFSNEEDFIYTGGYGNYSFEAGSYGNEETYFIFNKLDKDLNILVEKFYFHKAYNVLYFFKRTSDGGFIYLSSSYNYQHPEKKLDVYILKVDKEGNLPVSIEKPKIKALELIVFPNPGKLYLNIQTAVQCIGGKFTIYDISGKQVFQQNITQRITQINTAHLPTGTYIYNYVFEGKEIENGKWIKNAL